MDLMDNQPEFTKSFWDYLDILVNEPRIAKGRELLEKYRKTFDAVEQAYGVDRYIITAIQGRRIELRHTGRRSSGAALDRDARLRRPAGKIISARNFSRRWRILQRGDVKIQSSGRFMGQRFRTDAVHADRVQTLRRRFRS